eukprot:gene19507-6714_t
MNSVQNEICEVFLDDHGQQETSAILCDTGPYKPITAVRFTNQKTNPSTILLTKH